MPQQSRADEQRRARLRLGALAEHHVADLTRRQGQLLALEALGFQHQETAGLLGLELRTIQHHAQGAHERVVPAGYEPTRSNAQLWSYCHLACCLAREWQELLGEGQTFGNPQAS